MARSLPRFTVPTLTVEQGAEVATVLQERLFALQDLAATLKHVHWNVVGPDFIAVHQMIDPQVDAVRAMIDATAERIATLGVSPVGTPGALVEARTWRDYPLGRATTTDHLRTLDGVYVGFVVAHRAAAAHVGEIDDVSHDLLVTHLLELELFHWFVRAHLETADGALPGLSGETPVAVPTSPVPTSTVPTAAPAPSTRKTGASKAPSSRKAAARPREP